MKYGMVAVVLALAAGGAWWLWGDSNQPAGSANARSTDQPGKPMVDVTVPELSGDAVIGARVFEARCSACHGANAAGNDGFGPPLVHRYYAGGHHGDMAFVLAAQRGVRSHHWKFGDMPPVEGITRAEVDMVVAYVRALQAANGLR